MDIGGALLLYVLIISIYLGIELNAKVPSTLHTPLMSGANAMMGITAVGAFGAAGLGQTTIGAVLGVVALAFASGNVVGGYCVTDRILEMFKPKGAPPKRK